MGPISPLLVAWYAIGSLVGTSAGGSYMVKTERLLTDPGLVRGESHLRRRLEGHTAGDEPTVLGGSLYWSGNFSVGASRDLRLLLDTGSADCVLNPGVYKPSDLARTYNGSREFSGGYEGVTRLGFGFEIINGTVETDVVSAGGLTFDAQAIGNISHFRYIDAPRYPYASFAAKRADGLIGFSPRGGSAFTPESPSWFFNLANHGLLSEKRFGVISGTSGNGLFTIGTLERKFINGSLYAAADSGEFGEFTVQGDLTVDGQIFAANQTLIMDYGESNIQPPVHLAERLFATLGWQTHTRLQNNLGTPVTTVLAYFDCDKPPTIGFSFPAQSQLKPGEKAKNFDISPAVWDVYRHRRDRTNCTSIIGGTNAYASVAGNAWILGQPFFAGHYVDFDISEEPHTVSFGDLIDPSMSGLAD